MFKKGDIVFAKNSFVSDMKYGDLLEVTEVKDEIGERFNGVILKTGEEICGFFLAPQCWELANFCKSPLWRLMNEV
jgi:hypothetical protein